MARTGAGLELHQRRRVRRQAAGLRVEQELEHLVGAEVRHEDEAVGVVGEDGVRVARGRDHLLRLADAAVRADRIDADQVAAVGRAEQEASASCRQDVREALRERRRCRRASARRSCGRCRSVSAVNGFERTAATRKRLSGLTLIGITLAPAL